MIQNTKKTFLDTAPSMVCQTIVEDARRIIIMMPSNDQWIGEKFLLIGCFFFLRDTIHILYCSRVQV